MIGRVEMGMPGASINWPTLSSILPTLHICYRRRSLFHVFDHLWPVVLIDAGRRIDITCIAMRLANAEIEAAAIIRVRCRVHEILQQMHGTVEIKRVRLADI